MKNIVTHSFDITTKERAQLKGHKGLVLWFTGLSGSGKSTIANALEKELTSLNIHTYTLDGDNVRKGLNQNLTFSPQDRTENIRRIAEVANLIVDAGVVVLAAFVSPYKKDREEIKQIVGADNFIEVFVNTSVEECERRDVKGLYKKARLGEIKNFTGVNAPYEAPETPDIEIITENMSPEEAIKKIEKVIKKNVIV